MPKIIVVFHSCTGHVHRLAEALADGARSVESCVVDLAQVPDDTFPDAGSVARVVEARKGFAHVAAAKPEDLVTYDGFAFGTPTRLGNMSPAMRRFLDATGGAFLTGAFLDKPATVFCSTSSGGGQETTITSFWHSLAHLGMLIMPLGYRDMAVTEMNEARGGGPYGAAALSKADGIRPTAKELGLARSQGRALAAIVRKLVPADVGSGVA